MGGAFGMYFNVVIKWYGQNMDIPNSSILFDRCCYYFNAKRLLIKIVNEIVSEGISIENMIYFNNGYSFGNINCKIYFYNRLITFPCLYNVLP